MSFGKEQEPVSGFSSQKEHRELLTVEWPGRSARQSGGRWCPGAQADKLQSLIKEYNTKKPEPRISPARCRRSPDSGVPARRQVSLGAPRPEQSIRDGHCRVFSTPERRPGCPLRRRGRAALGSHPRSAGQVSAARGAASPIGADGG